jgi:hypothetical protein
MLHKDKDYAVITIAQKLVVPLKLVGKLMDILSQCGSQEWVYRVGATPSLYFARPLRLEVGMRAKVDQEVYALTDSQFNEYSKALKDTIGDEVMGATEWLALTK